MITIYVVCVVSILSAIAIPPLLKRMEGVYSVTLETMLFLCMVAMSCSLAYLLNI